MEGVKAYDEDQVALVIPDLTTFRYRVLVTLGTPTLNWIMNVIKESKIDELPVSLNGMKISHLLARHCTEFHFKNDTTESQIPNPSDLNETVKTMKWEEMDAFSSKIVHHHTKTVFLGNNMHVMMQAQGREKNTPCHMV